MIKKCKHCNKIIDVIGNLKYCSKRCKQAATLKSYNYICKHCGNEYTIKTTRLPKYHKKYCSKKCSTTASNQNPSTKQKIVTARQKTIKEKYGVTDSAQIPGRVDKWKKTMQEKYGSETYNNIEQRKITWGRKKIFEIESTGFWTAQFSINKWCGSDKLHTFKCNKCNRIFESNLKHYIIDNDKRAFPKCEYCFPNNKSSLPEIELCEYLKSIGVDKIVKADRKILSGLELDLYLPSHQIAIEYNGLYWHSENNGKDKNYHINKTKLCEEKNIQLIHIFEDEWLYKQDIVKSRLKSKLKLIKTTIGARKTTIKKIDAKTKNKFLFENHIQGSDRAKVKLGAFFNDKLIGVMTFSNLRIALGNKSKNGEYELSRFCSKLNTNIPGLGSKMLKHFILNYKPTNIISYSDNRWNTGHGYYSMGFKLVDNGQPNYWYVISKQRFHRFTYRKDQQKKLLKYFNPILTEVENMKLNGFDRVWDCGSNKFILNLN